MTIGQNKSRPYMQTSLTILTELMSIISQLKSFYWSMK